MNGSLTLLDDNLLYIAFSIIGLSGKNEQKMKFRGRGVGQRPNRSLNPLNEIRQPPTFLCTTSNFLVYNLQLPHTYNLKFQMYNLQLPCVQPPTSSYNLKFQMYNLQFTWVQPPTSSYNLKFQMYCLTSNFLIITMIILVMVLAAMWSRDTLERLLNPRQN